MENVPLPANSTPREDPSTPEAARAALAKRDSLRGFPSQRAARRAAWQSRAYDRGITIND